MNAIIVKNLQKAYGKNKVLRGINFNVGKGTMVALLGPNGAGKTTTVRILSTLLNYDKGDVRIEGFDVKKGADDVRRVIGLTGQSAAVDEMLTGRENLVMMGQLYHLSSRDAKARAEQLLKDFDLVDAAKRPLKSYSGGMRRRLDLAISLIATPPVIFLDEPTTGLDPRSRIAMWEQIDLLKKSGATILLTTQYLEEADRLADHVIVIDGGKVIAEGTATELKRKVGKDRLELIFATDTPYDQARTLFGKRADGNDDEKTLTLILNDTNKDVLTALQKLSDAGIKFASMNIHKPTLDDVFLNLTGRKKTAEKTIEKKTEKK